VPEARILGEEFGATGARDAEYTLTLDPIDGTAAFIAGLPTWCVTIGLVRHGIAVGGVTYLPMTGETYLADGERAEWNGRALLRHTRPPGEGDLFMLPANYHRARPAAFGRSARSADRLPHGAGGGAAVAAVLGGRATSPPGRRSCARSAASCAIARGTPSISRRSSPVSVLPITWWSRRPA
jgi:fructose-1,6-bisphosphatase/inositol monophosphatase family enzyme